MANPPAPPEFDLMFMGHNPHANSSAAMQQQSEASRKKVWTQQEDDMLRELVLKHGERAWSRIADELKQVNASKGEFPGRIGKQCRDRWCNHLSPDLDKKKWTADEDTKLFNAVRNVGNQWAEIARTVLPGRSDLSIKNRYYSRMRRENRKLEVTGGEDPSGSEATDEAQAHKKPKLQFGKATKSTQYAKSKSSSQSQPSIGISSSEAQAIDALQALLPPPPPPPPTTSTHIRPSLQFSPAIQPFPSLLLPPPPPSSSAAATTAQKGDHPSFLTSSMLHSLFSPLNSPSPSPPRSPTTQNRMLPSRPTSRPNSRPVSPATVMGVINQYQQQMSQPPQQAPGDLSLLSSTAVRGAGTHSPVLSDFDMYGLNHHNGANGFRLSPSASSASTPATFSSLNYFSASTVAAAAAAHSQQHQQQQQQQQQQQSAFFSRTVGGIELLSHPPSTFPNHHLFNMPCIPPPPTHSTPAAAATVAPLKKPRKLTAPKPRSNSTTEVLPGSSNTNVGRWTPEEHERFEKGLALFGTQDWAKITEYVQTRTIVQIRSHAQKYFLKLGGANNAGGGPGEDIILGGISNPETTISTIKLEPAIRQTGEGTEIMM